MFKNFDYYYKDTLCTSIRFDPVTGEPTVTNYVPETFNQFLGKLECTPDNLLMMFEDHCWNRNRPDINELLAGLGLKEYDPYAICLKTNGRVATEHYHIVWLD